MTNFMEAGAGDGGGEAPDMGGGGGDFFSQCEEESTSL